VEFWVKRRRPYEREVFTQTSAWVLFVLYSEDGNEHAARLPLSDDAVAERLEALLAAWHRGEVGAARDLFVCLHAEWGQIRLVRRHPAWDALFRTLAPLAAGAATAAGT
jgi:hypothetical protein